MGLCRKHFEEAPPYENGCRDCKLEHLRAERDRLREDLRLLEEEKVIEPCNGVGWQVETTGAVFDTLRAALDAAREDG